MVIRHVIIHSELTEFDIAELIGQMCQVISIFILKSILCVKLHLLVVQCFKMSYICTWMLSAEEAEEDTEEGLRLINRLNSVCSGVDNI